MRRGFSFTEILFAVMILGIGFIMVAAMFPVAIQQTQATSQESISATIGRAGVDYMQQLASIRCTMATGRFVSTGIIPAGTPTSILLPTLDPSSLSNTSTTFPVGTVFPVRISGQVWSLHETTLRDPYQVTVAGSSRPANHADALWQVASHNLVFPTDPRYGMAIMYKRDLIGQVVAGTTIMSYSPAPDAQIIVIAMQAQARATYQAAPANTRVPCDVAHYSSAYPATLEPILANATSSGSVRIVRQGTASVLTITDTNVLGQSPPGRVAEGTYLVIAQDGQGNAAPGGSGGQYAGHIFQVGAQLTTNTWFLAPGNDLTSVDPVGFTGRGPQVLLVGRGYTDPTNPATGGYTGGAQDIGVFTGFIPVN